MDTTKKTIPDEIVINGTTLRVTPCIYQISNRKALDAPDVFVELESTMLPSAGIKECPNLMLYDEYSKIYDTGFFPQSPCYRGKPKDEVEEQVAWLTKHIVEPFDAERGLNMETGKSHLHHTNNEFWDNEIFGLDGNTRIDPSHSVYDLLVLYSMIRSGYVAPEDEKIGKTVLLRGAKFIIKDGGKKVNKAKNRVVQKYATMAKFLGLVQTDRKGLVAGLRYRKCEVQDSMSDEDLQFFFDEWLQRNPQAHELFNDIGVMLADDIGQQTIWIFTALEELYRTHKLKTVGMDYWYEGTSLGSDFRQIARNLAESSKPALLKVRKALLEDSGVTKKIPTPTIDDNVATMKSYMQEVGIPMPQGKKDKKSLFEQIEKYS